MIIFFQSISLIYQYYSYFFYDILHSIIEFGITENALEAPKVTGLEAPLPQKEAIKPTTEKEREEFGGFVEINEEKEDEANAQKASQENVFGDFGQDLQFDFGGTKKEETEKKAGDSDWAFGDFGGHDFGQSAGNQPRNNDEGFDDFEQPQVAQPQEDKLHKEGDDFADFQGFDSNTNQKGTKISNDNFEYIEGDHDKKDVKSNTEANIWGDFGVAGKSKANVEGFDFSAAQVHKEEAFNEGFEEFQYNDKNAEKNETEEHHAKDIKKEHKDNEEDFDDFEEYNAPISEEKKKEKMEIGKEEKEDEFVLENKERIVNEKEEVRKSQEISKKLTIYDIDLAGK